MTDPLADMLTRVRNANAASLGSQGVGALKLQKRVNAWLRRLLEGAAGLFVRWAQKLGAASNATKQRWTPRRDESKASSESGLASAPRLAATSVGVPVRIRFTGTSSFFPDSVRGMPETA